MPNEVTTNHTNIACDEIRHGSFESTDIWRDICALDALPPGTGAAALIEGHQVALVRMPDGVTVYAVDHFDPFSKAFVIARGIVGDKGGVPKIASPIYKQAFDLRNGTCLDDPTVALAHWPARVHDGRIQILWGKHDGTMSY